MPRRVYKKRSYKKRVYKTRRYKKRYNRYRFYKRNAIKKPEIRIIRDNNRFVSNHGGDIRNLTMVGGSPTTGQDGDNIQYTINGTNIEGKKIRLKYLYIKGYFMTNTDTDINAKIYVFRRKTNTSNSSLSWGDLMDLPLNFSAPNAWTDDNIRDILYKYDWKNDIKNKITHKVKNLYRRYDATNNIIPFKIRIPLYDCVLTCDCSNSSSALTTWTPNENPSTNGLYMSFITSQPLDATNVNLNYKTKLYYTDY